MRCLVITTLFILLLFHFAFCSGAEQYTEFNWFQTSPLCLVDLAHFGASVDFPDTLASYCLRWGSSDIGFGIHHWFDIIQYLLTNGNIHGSIWTAFCRGACLALDFSFFLLLNINTPFFAAFCGGAFCFFILHGFAKAFCRGAYNIQCYCSQSGDLLSLPWFFVSTSDTTIADLWLQTDELFLDLRHWFGSAWQPRRGCKPGPKSGHHWCIWQVFFAGILPFFLQPILTSDGGEGCGHSMVTTGASSPPWLRDLSVFDAKQHGPRPVATSEHLSWAPTDTSIKKRSIKRAYKRACRDGLCWYRGQRYTPADFPAQLQAQTTMASHPPCLTPSGHRDLKQYNGKHGNGRRLQFISWNVASLSQSRLDEIRLWALEQNISALALLETRWSWTGEWQDEHWTYVHSGDPSSRGSGILIMICRKLGSDLRWRECMPGRLVHVQLRLSPRYLDFLACYQFSFQSNTTRQADRLRWWECFESVLGRLATRHVLAIAGDFNCSLPISTSQVGHPGYQWQGQMSEGTVHGDSDIFIHILRTYDLNVLNSWNPALGPTFVGMDCHSRIDFCITRQHMADGFSRDVKYLWNASIKSDFKDHCPILFQLNKYWIPAPLHGSRDGCTFQQRVQCRLAYLEDNDTWRGFLHQTLATAADHMHASDPHDPDIPPNLHALVLQDFHSFFPPLQSCPCGLESNCPSFLHQMGPSTSFFAIGDLHATGFFHRSILFPFLASCF